MLNRSEPTSAIETISIDQAKRWLDDPNRPPNRAMSHAKGKRFGEQMKDGKWGLITGDSVKIDWNGHLADGQHRLLGVILSGIPLRTLVVRGIDPAAIYRTDIGKKRTGADALTIEGIPSAAAVASVVRSICILDMQDARLHAETYLIVEINAKYPSISEMTRRWRSQINPDYYDRWCAALGWVYTHVGKGEVEQDMFNYFKDGSMPYKGYPGFALRDALANKNKKLVGSDRMALAIRAFHEAANNIIAPRVYAKPRTYDFDLVPEFVL